ncbi:protein kinase-like domain, Phloem protein 2-like protein [Artemisia annua]|uniref:Protein kinase-like domain, Phloem protein 2-like protein n=1 Tax=Artemisia annua TaxID=35608 RepID=A0A2U1LJ77_ARTAN|nr:protein kinase-like domain, Phloem protein 2-like protein [Artemisia annua]
MDSIMKEFEHLAVKLEEVKSATDNFNDTKIIGKGGFGYVYEGEVSQPRGKTKAAFKRLDRKHGQGDPQFWKEVMMLSRYTHENLISLLGYCNEGGEMILVYEHASNGSLDRHLRSTTLTWTQRIRICHDAAKGLCYLHEDRGNHRVLHRDIKCSNILLDENWKAKVSDMGLAKVGPANQFTFLITDNVVGTFGYIDPMYLRKGFLTKESDVYSFGVVLFEVLCGRLCFDYSGNIVHIWKQRYEENKLDEIVFKDDLVQALDQSSLEVFSEIAFQCLQESREERPLMADVVEKLEIALKSQELVDLVQKEYEEIVKAAVPPLIYRSVEELKVLLSKGVILNGGKTWLSVNEKGEHTERIYIEACNPQVTYWSTNQEELLTHPTGDIVNSRFPEGLCYNYDWGGFKAHALTYTPVIGPKLDENTQNPVTRPSKLNVVPQPRSGGWMEVKVSEFQTETISMHLRLQHPGKKDLSGLMVQGIEIIPI